MNEDSYNSLKRYRLLLLLVFLLLVLGIGYWFVKKRNPNRTNARKDEVLRQLNQRNR